MGSPRCMPIFTSRRDGNITRVRQKISPFKLLKPLTPRGSSVGDHGLNTKVDDSKLHYHTKATRNLPNSPWARRDYSGTKDVKKKKIIKTIGSGDLKFSRLPTSDYVLFKDSIQQ